MGGGRQRFGGGSGGRKTHTGSTSGSRRRRWEALPRSPLDSGCRKPPSYPSSPCCRSQRRQWRRWRRRRYRTEIAAAGAANVSAGCCLWAGKSQGGAGRQGGRPVSGARGGEPATLSAFMSKKGTAEQHEEANAVRQRGGANPRRLAGGMPTLSASCRHGSRFPPNSVAHPACP